MIGVCIRLSFRVPSCSLEVIVRVSAQERWPALEGNQVILFMSCTTSWNHCLALLTGSFRKNVGHAQISEPTKEASWPDRLPPRFSHPRTVVQLPEEVVAVMVTEIGRCRVPFIIELWFWRQLSVATFVEVVEVLGIVVVFSITEKLVISSVS